MFEEEHRLEADVTEGGGFAEGDGGAGGARLLLEVERCDGLVDVDAGTGLAEVVRGGEDQRWAIALDGFGGVLGGKGVERGKDHRVEFLAAGLLDGGDQRAARECGVVA